MLQCKRDTLKAEKISYNKLVEKKKELIDVILMKRLFEKVFEK
tara:strand:- start:231 stop:359 length:129 start_codon:yes stop_codon:yes gene_type:complete